MNTLRTSDLDSVPADLARRFSLYRLLGQGAMGRVFLGSLPETDKPCALKVIVDLVQEELLMRFLREARLLSRVHHPHLVDIYDCAVEPACAWIAMEHIDGVDLQAAVNSLGPLPVARVEEVARALAGALSALHAEGIVHRDVKPANIMLDGSERTVLMDLGLARDTEGTVLTRTGNLVGTPLFMAPELLQGDTATAAADWYALGISLHFLLLGRSPLDPETAMAMLRTGLWRDLPRITGPASGTPVAAVAEALTVRAPEERPGSLEEILRLLEPGPDPGPAPGGVVESSPAPPEPPTRTPECLSSEATSSPHSASAPSRPWWRGAALVLVALGLLGWAAWQGGDVGPRPLPTRVAGETSSVATPTTTTLDPRQARGRGEDRARDSLLRLCTELGYPDEAWPHAVLRAHCSVVPLEERLQLQEKLAERKQGGYLRWMVDSHVAGEQGDDAIRVLLARRRFSEVPEEFWPGIELVWSLGHRYRLANLDGDEAARRAARDDAARLDRTLAARGGLDALMLRVELWEYLHRRTEDSVTENHAALEMAAALVDDLLERWDELPPDLRLRAYRNVSKVLAKRGELDRQQVLAGRYRQICLNALRDPGLAAWWQEASEEDARRMAGTIGLLGIQDIVKSVHDPARLPLPVGFPGSAPKGTALEEPVVSGARRPPMELSGDPPEDPEIDLAEVGETALLLGRDLVPSARWRDLVLAPAADASAGDPVRGWLLRLPSLALSLEAPLCARGQEDSLLALLREIKQWIRHSPGHQPEQRRWFRGTWAAHTRTLLALERQFGSRRRFQGLVREELEAMAGMYPPWTLEELRLGIDIWREVHAATPCKETAREILRLGLRYLEAVARLGQRAAGHRELAAGYRKVLVTLLEDTGEDAPDGSCREEVEALSHPFPPASFPIAQGTPGERLDRLTGH